LTTAIWAQQCAPQVDHGPVFEKAPPVIPYSPSQFSHRKGLQPCPAVFEFHPEVDGIYKGGAGITPPKVTQFVAVGLTKEARDAYKKNLFKDPNDVVSRISVVVDTKGHLQELCLQSAAGFGLDKQAADAVRQYRFTPGSKDGRPIAVRMTIEVNYQTH